MLIVAAKGYSCPHSLHSLHSLSLFRADLASFVWLYRQSALRHYRPASSNPSDCGIRPLRHPCPSRMTQASTTDISFSCHGSTFKLKPVSSALRAEDNPSLDTYPSMSCTDSVHFLLPTFVAHCHPNRPCHSLHCPAGPLQIHGKLILFTLLGSIYPSSHRLCPMFVDSLVTPGCVIPSHTCFPP